MSFYNYTESVRYISRLYLLRLFFLHFIEIGKRLTSRRCVFKFFQMITAVTGLVTHYYCPVLRSPDSYLLIPAIFGAVFVSSTGDFLSLMLDIAGPPLRDLLSNATTCALYYWALCSMMDSLEYDPHQSEMLFNCEVIKSFVAAFGFILHFCDSMWQLVDFSLKEILPVKFTTGQNV